MVKSPSTRMEPLLKIVTFAGIFPMLPDTIYSMASIAEKSLLSPPDIGERRPRFRSQRTLRFTESVIREMSRLASEHKAVNLAQGFPDFPAPEVIKNAARDAIAADINQYA